MKKKATPSPLFETLFKQGTVLLHQGQAAQAVPLLEQAHKLNPEHIDAAINLSGAYILEKKFGKAISILEPLQEQAAGNAMFWTNLAAAYLGNPVLARDEEQQKAIDTFKLALEINPTAPHVAYNIGLICRDRQETAEAIGWFKRAVQADPRDQDARRILRRLTSGRSW